MNPTGSNRQRQLKRRICSAKRKETALGICNSSGSSHQTHAVRLIQQKDKVLHGDATTVTSGRITMKQGIFLKGKSSGSVSKGSVGWTHMSKARAEANLTHILELANNNNERHQQYSTAVDTEEEDDLRGYSQAPHANLLDKQRDVGSCCGDANNAIDHDASHARRRNKVHKEVAALRGSNTPNHRKTAHSERKRKASRQPAVPEANCTVECGGHEPIFLKVENCSGKKHARKGLLAKPKVGFDANTTDAASASDSSEGPSSSDAAHKSQEVPYKRFNKRINLKLEECINKLKGGRNLSDERLKEISQAYKHNYDQSTTEGTRTSAENCSPLLQYPRSAVTGVPTSAAYLSYDHQASTTAATSMSAVCSAAHYSLNAMNNSFITTTNESASATAIGPSTTWCTTLRAPSTSVATITTSSCTEALLSLDFSIHPEQVITSPRAMLCKYEMALQHQHLHKQAPTCSSDVVQHQQLHQGHLMSLDDVGQHQQLHKETLRTSSDVAGGSHQTALGNCAGDGDFALLLSTDISRESALVKPCDAQQLETSETSRIFCAPPQIFNDGPPKSLTENAANSHAVQQQCSSRLGYETNSHDKKNYIAPYSFYSKDERFQYPNRYYHEGTVPGIEEHNLTTPIGRKTSTMITKSVIVDPLSYLAKCAEQYSKLPTTEASSRDQDSIIPEDNVIFPSREQIGPKAIIPEGPFPMRTSEMGEASNSVPTEVFVPTSFAFNPPDGGRNLSSLEPSDQNSDANNPWTSSSIDVPVTLFEFDCRSSKPQGSSSCYPAMRGVAGPCLPPSSNIETDPYQNTCMTQTTESETIFPKMGTALQENVSYSISGNEVVENVSRASDHNPSSYNNSVSYLSSNFPNPSSLQANTSCNKPPLPAFNARASCRCTNAQHSLNDQGHRYLPSSENDISSTPVQQHHHQYCSSENQIAKSKCACMKEHSQGTQHFCPHGSVAIVHDNNSHVNWLGNPSSSSDAGQPNTKCNNCPGCSSNQTFPQEHGYFPRIVKPPIHNPSVDVVRSANFCSAHASSQACHCASCVDKREHFPRQSSSVPKDGPSCFDLVSKRCFGRSVSQLMVPSFVSDSNRTRLASCALPSKLSPPPSCSSASHCACHSRLVEPAFSNRGGNQSDRCSSSSQGCSQELRCDRSWERTRPAGMDWVDMNHSEMFSDTAPPISSSLRSCIRRSGGPEENTASEHTRHCWSSPGGPPAPHRVTSLASHCASKTCYCRPPDGSRQQHHHHHHHQSPSALFQ